MGYVTPDGEVRIRNVEGYQFDIAPTEYMLAVRNEDKPGMIGQIGTLLGASQVNIATMQVSRNQKDGVAMMFLSVDNTVTAEVLKLLQGVAGIKEVHLLTF